VPLDLQGGKKSETEQILFRPKQAERKKKSKGQSEDISHKVPQFVPLQFRWSPSDTNTLEGNDLITVLWDVGLCSVMVGDQQFGGAIFMHYISLKKS
jgi:hypothetical protein